jgi:hypothetical protein
MAMWEGNADLFVELLKKYEFIDDATMLVHNWFAHTKNYLWQKYHQSDPRKYKRIQSLYKNKKGRPQGHPKDVLKDVQPIASIASISSISSLNLKRGSAEGEASGWPSPEKLVALYNEKTPDECPAVNTLTPARRQKAKRYLATFPKEQFWIEVFVRVHQSKFLRGLARSNGNGHGGFRFDFDWMLTKGKDGSENVIKVHEGKYADER